MDNLLLIVLVVALVAGLALMGGLSLDRRKGLNHNYYKERWQRIQNLSQQGDGGWQLAIIEADSLLDEALKSRNMPGDTMGGRLKSARAALAQHNNAVWDAHKLRNRIAHEGNIRLNSVVVGQALRGFKAGLKNMGAL